MNVISQMQHYVNWRPRVVYAPIMAAMLISATGYAGPVKAEGAPAQKETLRINVTGTVRDNKGEPLPGVSVKIKGTTTGTSTDVNGVFRLNLPTGNETLVFSFLGFKTQEYPVNGKMNLDVRLQEDIQSLDEVIITGYGGKTTKGTNTGAIDAINAKEIEDLPLGNLGAALSGRLLGVAVSGGTSRPGSQASLTIRNPMSLAKDGGNNNPLYVIDDVIQVTSQGAPDATLFNSLDPSEVESITILKDAAAAIYGSRAANGAVIVTTKRGKVGKPRVSYSGSIATNQETFRTKMLDAYEFAQYMNIMNGPNGAGANPGENNFFTEDELEHFKTIDHDWLEDNWKNGSNTRHTFNVSGGADKSTYFANVSYYTQNGNLSTVDYDKWTYRAGADVNLLNNLKAGLQVSGNFNDRKTTLSRVGGQNLEGDYINLLRTPRYIPPYVDGYAVRPPGTATNNLSAYNYYEIQRLGNLQTNDEKFSTINLYAEYELPFVKGLKARASYARNQGSNLANQVGTYYFVYNFDRQGANNHIYEGATVIGNPVRVNNYNRILYQNTNGKSSQLNFSANYSRQIGLHNVNAFFTVEKAEAESAQQDVYKDNPLLSTNGQFSSAFGAVDGSTTGSESGTLGYVARGSYSYADKYNVDLMFRTDASTKFSPDNYWGRFYSLGLGWVISKERFFNLPAVNFLKVRYSVGLLGKDDTRAWQWRQRYTFQNGKGSVFGADNAPSTTGMKMEVSPNPEATWSDDFKQNVGLDARFLKSRLSTTVEGFYNKGTNMLIERTGNVPVTVGGSIASENWGKVDFFGYELAVGWDDNVGKDFRYGINTRFSWYDNKVHRLNYNQSDLAYPWNPGPGRSSDNGVWGHDYLGMFKTMDDVNAYVNQYNITVVNPTGGNTPVLAKDLKPGMLYYRDVRGALQPDGTFAGPDGIIDKNDQIQLAKKAANHYSLGMTLKAGYKGLSFDAVIVGSFGGWAEHDIRDKMNNNIGNSYLNLPKYWNNVYDPVINPNGTLPNPHHQTINLDPISKFYQVSSFRMRMTNFNINYSLPSRITKAMKISNGRVVFTGVNPINFFNPYDYRDPEGSWLQFPVLRTYSIGVNLTL